jgi:hypothetical protein
MRQAGDKEKWRRLLREVRAQMGLWRHTWMDGWILKALITTSLI